MKENKPCLLLLNDIHISKDNIPAFQANWQEAMEDYTDLAEQVRQAAGDELYDQYCPRLMRFTGYEVRAYYALGLGLRKELFQALEA